MAKKKVLIAGILCRDCAYLTKPLLEHGYAVFGETRRSGAGVEATACDRKTGRLLAGVEVEFFRLAEVHALKGDGARRAASCAGR